MLAVFNTRPLLILIGFILTISSCKITAPTFKGVENAQIQPIGKTGLSLRADVVIHNPNWFRIKVWDIAANVLLDDKVISRIGDSTVMLIRSKRDFKIPLAVSLNPQENILDQLKNVLNSILKREATPKIQGNIRAKVLCRKYSFPFLHEQKINSSSFQR